MGTVARYLRLGVGSVLLIVTIWGVAIPAAGQTGDETGAYDQTRGLAGADLASALNLGALSFQGEEPKELFEDCFTSKNAMLVEVGNGVAYCTGAVTTDPIEAWDIAARLRGRFPTGEEFQAKALEIEANQLDEAGHHNRAVAVYDEAADWLVGEGSL